MKINRERYATIVDASVAEGPSDVLAEIEGVPVLQLWDDIDLDLPCLGRIDWFGEESSTLHMSADVTLEAFHKFKQLLLDTDFRHNPTLHATGVGLKSIEFTERELQKGVAITNVSVAVRSRLNGNEEVE